MVYREDFRDFADFLFSQFGDRVKYWITINEPWTFSRYGYAIGKFSPARCSDWQRLDCTGGDSGREPYAVAHNQLLAHAAIVNLYRKKYQVLFFFVTYKICQVSNVEKYVC